MSTGKLPPDEIKYEDLDDLIKEGRHYQEEIREMLKDIKVPVTKLHPHVLESINTIFGPDYISKDGKAYITFDMVLECLNITRNVGKATADEFI